MRLQEKYIQYTLFVITHYNKQYYTEIGNAAAELKQAKEKWRTRDLSHEKIKYLIIDGVNFRMLAGGSSIENIPTLGVTEAKEDNTWLVLILIQSGDKESASAYSFH
jgi:hypothetical protein